MPPHLDTDGSRRLLTPASCRRPTILVVDDDPTFLGLVVEIRTCTEPRAVLRRWAALDVRNTGL